jgi:hypothetical protein
MSSKSSRCKIVMDEALAHVSLGSKKLPSFKYTPDSIQTLTPSGDKFGHLALCVGCHNSSSRSFIMACVPFNCVSTWSVEWQTHADRNKATTHLRDFSNRFVVQFPTELALVADAMQINTIQHATLFETFAG